MKKKYIATTLLAVMTIIMTGCNTNEALEPTPLADGVPVAITANAPVAGDADTRAVKTTFAVGDVITISGSITATYTLQTGGEWTRTDSNEPAMLPISANITLNAAFTPADATSGGNTTFADRLTAKATNLNVDGSITLGILPGGEPVWNVVLNFVHARPVVDVKVVDEAKADVTNLLQSVTLTTQAGGTTYTTQSTGGTDIILEAGSTITKVTATVANFTYTAVPKAHAALTGGMRYTLTFTCKPKGSTVTVDTPLAWNKQPGVYVKNGYDYYITDKASFKAWRTAMNTPANLTKKAVQLADIEWTAADGVWMPVGNSTNKFGGVYNGNGHSISGLKIGLTSGESISGGMFGYVSNNGVVLTGIHLWHASLESDKSEAYLGLLVGRLGSQAVVSLCSAQGFIKAESSFVGGLVGFSDTQNHFSRCYTDVTIQTTDGNAGGLIGFTNQQNMVVACGANAYISVSNPPGTVSIGGLVGNMSQDNHIYFCYSTGSINKAHAKPYSCIGGLVGTTAANNSVFYSYSAATVTSTSIGTQYVGSLIGYFSSSLIATNCFAVGTSSNGKSIGKKNGGTVNSPNISELDEYGIGNSTAKLRACITPNPAVKTAIGVKTTSIDPIDDQYGITPVLRFFTSNDTWGEGTLPAINYTYNGVM